MLTCYDIRLLLPHGIVIDDNLSLITLFVNCIYKKLKLTSSLFSYYTIYIQLFSDVHICKFSFALWIAISPESSTV